MTPTAAQAQPGQPRPVVSADGVPHPSPACPACGHRHSVCVQTLAVGDQHARYARNDPAAVQRLQAAWDAQRPPKHAHGDANADYTVLRCGACALEFADPLFAPSPDWYGALYGTLNLYPAQRWEYQVVLDALQPHDRVLDYGCGSGHFLSQAATRVAQAVGIDFSSDGVAQATGRGLQAQLAQPGAAWPVQHGQASVITAFHVLEHLPDPADLFRQARLCGQPQVQLWLAIPSDRRASRRYGEADELDAPPHHLTRWTPAALRSLGQQQGWLMETLLYEPLPLSTRVWEAGRRSAWVQRLERVPTAAGRLARRAAAAAVWLSGRHAMAEASGFSMLARFTPTTRDPS